MNISKEILKFVKGHNSQITVPGLRITSSDVNEFLRDRPKILAKNLDLTKHRVELLDWLLDTETTRERSRAVVAFDFLAQPIKTKLISKKVVDKELMPWVSSSGAKINTFGAQCMRGWSPLCLTVDSYFYCYKNKRKKNMFTELLAQDFLNLDLPYIFSHQTEPYNLDLYKSKILRFIETHGLIFNELEDFLDEEDLFFRYFIHRWGLIKSLLNSRTIEKLRSKDGSTTLSQPDVDIVNIGTAKVIPLYETLKKPGVQTPGYETHFARLVAGIVDPQNNWTRCGYEKCGQWFKPQGKKKRACCKLHADRLKAKLARIKKSDTI